MRSATAISHHELLRAAIEQAGDAVIITDLSGTIEFVNAAFERLTGYSRSEAVGANPRILKSGRQTAQTYEAMWKALLCGREWTGRVFNRRKDGTLYAAECRTTPIASTGDVTTHFVQIQRDISREVDLENSLRHREEALLQSEERFRILVEDAPDAMILSGPDGTMVLANRQAERCFGYRREELVGAPIEMLVPAQNREQHREGCRRLFAQGLRARSMHESLDLFALRRNGEVFPVEVCISPIRTDASVCVLCSLRDLTERRQLERQLRQAQKMEAVGRLAGGIAHDFNNLLSVILTYSAVIMNSLAPEDPLRQEVGEIKKAGERAGALTHQLLAFSRQQVLQPKIINLNAIVDGMAAMLCRLIGEDIQLVTRTEPALGWVKVDPGQMEQVVLNLVVNARDAMPDGGKVTIETGNAHLDETYAREHDDVSAGTYVMLAVCDTGHGMDDSTRSRLFEPFFTTKPKGQGTGLGLSTTHGIIKQSGGHISVDSEPGRGSAFKVYLPAVEVPHVESRRPPPENNRLNGSETILLVEDDDQVRAVARRILARQGYRVIEAAGADDALRAYELHAGAIDLLVSDVVMPMTSGPQLAALLVARHPGLRVLFMSGYTPDAIVHDGVLDQGLNFVEKPLTPQSLAAKVREVLDKS